MTKNGHPAPQIHIATMSCSMWARWAIIQTLPRCVNTLVICPWHRVSALPIRAALLNGARVSWFDSYLSRAHLTTMSRRRLTCWPRTSSPTSSALIRPFGTYRGGMSMAMTRIAKEGPFTPASSKTCAIWRLTWTRPSWRRWKRAYLIWFENY